jgi:peptide/nickel transport system ATP-binding protein
VESDRLPKRSRLLRDIGFSLSSGGSLGLVGASGAGKSLLSYALSGLLPRPLHISGGEFFWRGRQVEFTDPRAWRRLRGKEIFLVFQSPGSALNPNLNIGSQLRVVLTRVLGFPNRQARAMAAELMARVHISPDCLGRYPWQLSGGMRQRVLLALALALKPGLLIADEPTSGLDAVNQQRILQLIKELNREVGTALIFISHDLRAVREVAEQIGVIEQGELLELQNTKRLFANPQNAKTRHLLNGLSRLDQVYAKTSY